MKRRCSLRDLIDGALDGLGGALEFFLVVVAVIGFGWLLADAPVLAVILLVVVIGFVIARRRSRS